MKDNPEFPYLIDAVMFGHDGLTFNYVEYDHAADQPAILRSHTIQVPFGVTEDIQERIHDLVAAANDIVQFAEEHVDGQPKRLSPPTR